MRNRAELRRDHRSQQHPGPEWVFAARAAVLARATALAQFAAYCLLEPAEVPVRPTRIPITSRPQHIHR